jgi:hypothetical protein
MRNATKVLLASIVATLGFAAVSYGAEPVIDNDRVTVWDTTSALPPAEHDFVAIPLSHKGHAVFGHKGEIPNKAGMHAVVAEFKDNAVPPIANSTGLPLAFPRPHVHKLFENDRIVVWNYVWHPGEPTPMHFHDKDALVVYEGTGAMQSTTPDGKMTLNEFKSGEIRFNKRDRSHSELLLRGHVRAVITELK